MGLKYNYAILILKKELNAIKWKNMSSDTDYSKSIKQLEDAINIIEFHYEGEFNDD